MLWRRLGQNVAGRSFSSVVHVGTMRFVRRGQAGALWRGSRRRYPQLSECVGLGLLAGGSKKRG